MRLAIQQRAALVPVLCMGELDTLRNLIDIPHLQVCSPETLRQTCSPGQEQRCPCCARASWARCATSSTCPTCRPAALVAVALNPTQGQQPCVGELDTLHNLTVRHLQLCCLGLLMSTCVGVWLLCLVVGR